MEKIAGQIEQILFHRADTGYTVARMKLQDRADRITVVGDLGTPSPGEILILEGTWSQHPKYGKQFSVVSYRISAPVTAGDLERYLGSGLIKGIGPKMAQRIVKRFGSRTLDIIENRAETLAEVDGIGPKRIALISASWDEQKAVRDVMLFLQSYGVGLGNAAKIIQAYGRKAISVLRQNPYRLAEDIAGIGFSTADQIAMKLGIQKNSAARVQAGVLHVLNQIGSEGHVYYPYDDLLERSRQILAVSRQDVSQAVEVAAAESRIVVEELKLPKTAPAPPEKAVYPVAFHRFETQTATRIQKLLSVAPGLPVADIDKTMDWVQRQLHISLAAKQVQAIRWSLEKKGLIITGGPGTGKTTIINAILKIFNRMGGKTLMAAPTGRAAKRMSEATGRPAKTIHRLLEYNVQAGGFQRNEQNPLECALLVIDEASMVDLALAHALIRAIPLTAAFVLVGDIHQLPSVGPGNVLGDLIASGIMAVVELDEIFRQSESSRIVVNAHRIHQGRMPLGAPTESRRGPSDFYFIEQPGADQVLDLILELVCRRIPRRFGLDPLSDIQVLSPMHRGLVGTENLNARLQQALNPDGVEYTRAGRVFRVGDKVMQIKNNYDLDVFNGDIGTLVRIQPGQQTAQVLFDERRVTYQLSDLDQLVTAYAISVHKAQGSEYPAVVIPVLIQHYLLLQRNLIYTAVTRGRQLVVMAGSRKALAIGIRNNKPNQRFTGLERRLNSRTW